MESKKLRELIDNMKMSETESTYSFVSKELVNLFSASVVETQVSCNFGTGIIKEAYGNTLDDIKIKVLFDNDIVKQFSVVYIMDFNLMTFTNTKIDSLWSTLYGIQTDLNKKYINYKAAIKQLIIEAEQRAEEKEKLEERYQKARAKAIKDFNDMTQRNSEAYEVDEFYYALGWLAKNVGTVSAVLPDFLLNSFEKYFGNDANPKVIDSTKRTASGYAMKWTLGMTASIKKKAREAIPAILTPYLSSTRTSIAKTSFIWDLVDTYGFCFGKKQDIDKIKQTIPNTYISSFEAGYIA